MGTMGLFMQCRFFWCMGRTIHRCAVICLSPGKLQKIALPGARPMLQFC